MPTLIINGEKDRDVPLACAQKAHECIAGSQLYVLKDCGHWPQREMPDEFNHVVGKLPGCLKLTMIACSPALSLVRVLRVVKARDRATERQ